MSTQIVPNCLFQKILEARSPMYNIRYQKFTNKKLMDKFRQEYLFRVQYQTRRNMISALRSIRYLRKTKSLTVRILNEFEQRLVK